MPDILSANLNLLEQSTGTASGAWGANLNTLVFDILDGSLGGNQAVSLSSSNVSLTMTQRQHLTFTLSGVLTTGVSLVLPLQTTATTLAVGGFFIIDNQTTGAFAVTVKTAASGSTGVEVPQGVHSLVYSDTTNVWFADDAQNQTQTYNGNPNGNVAGKAGSASTRASKVIDRATNQEYLCTTSGTASSAVWSVNLPFTFPSQGYLSPIISTTNPIPTIDTTGATTIYYTAFAGNLFWVYNGVSFVPAPITGAQLALALSGSAQGANGIYDVIGFLNSGTPTIGFSPAWSVTTAGSCSRGSGAGTPQMTRINGIPVNAVQQAVNNGATAYTVAANRGTILGSVWIDSSAGQVTCHRSYGQSRKWGISNAYNRVPLYLKAGDSTASWTPPNSASYRPMDNSSNNSLTTFDCLAEEIYNLELTTTARWVSGSGGSPKFGIGVNSTATPTGQIANISPQGDTPAFGSWGSNYQMAPSLGINTITALELASASGSLTVYGTEASMLLAAQWRA